MRLRVAALLAQGATRARLVARLSNSEEQASVKKKYEGGRRGMLKKSSAQDDRHLGGRMSLPVVE